MKTKFRVERVGENLLRIKEGSMDITIRIDENPLRVDLPKDGAECFLNITLTDAKTGAVWPVTVTGPLTKTS